MSAYAVFYPKNVLADRAVDKSAKNAKKFNGDKGLSYPPTLFQILVPSARRIDWRTTGGRD